MYQQLIHLDNASRITMSAVTPAELLGYSMYITIGKTVIICRRSCKRSGVLEIVENKTGEHIFNIHNAEIPNQFVEATLNDGTIIGRIKKHMTSIVYDASQTIIKACEFEWVNEADWDTQDPESEIFMQEAPAGDIRFKQRVVEIGISVKVERPDVALILTYAIMHALTTHRQHVMSSPQPQNCFCFRAFTFANLAVHHNELKILENADNFKVKPFRNFNTSLELLAILSNTGFSLVCQRKAMGGNILDISDLERDLIWTVMGASFPDTSLVIYTKSRELGNIWENDLYYHGHSMIQQIFREYVFRKVGQSVGADGSKNYRYHVTRITDSQDVATIIFGSGLVTIDFVPSIVPPWLKAMVISFALHEALTSHKEDVCYSAETPAQFIDGGKISFGNEKTLPQSSSRSRSATSDKGAQGQGIKYDAAKEGSQRPCPTTKVEENEQSKEFKKHPVGSKSKQTGKQKAEEDLQNIQSNEKKKEAEDRTADDLEWNELFGDMNDLTLATDESSPLPVDPRQQTVQFSPSSREKATKPKEDDIVCFERIDAFCELSRSKFIKAARVVSLVPATQITNEKCIKYLLVDANDNNNVLLQITWVTDMNAFYITNAVENYLCHTRPSKSIDHTIMASGSKLIGEIVTENDIRRIILNQEAKYFVSPDQALFGMAHVVTDYDANIVANIYVEGINRDWSIDFLAMKDIAVKSLILAATLHLVACKSTRYALVPQNLGVDVRCRCDNCDLSPTAKMEEAGIDVFVGSTFEEIVLRQACLDSFNGILHFDVFTKLDCIMPFVIEGDIGPDGKSRAVFKSIYGAVLFTALNVAGNDILKVVDGDGTTVGFYKDTRFYDGDQNSIMVYNARQKKSDSTSYTIARTDNNKNCVKIEFNGEVVFIGFAGKLYPNYKKLAISFVLRLVSNGECKSQRALPRILYRKNPDMLTDIHVRVNKGRKAIADIIRQ